MDKTLFTDINYTGMVTFRSVGYNYNDTNYINIFRWLWNEHHIHPKITSFVNDPTNASQVTIYNTETGALDVFYCNSYDEAVIWVVEYVLRHIWRFFDKPEIPSEFF